MNCAKSWVRREQEPTAVYTISLTPPTAPHVREVKIIHLPGLQPKGDLWDWIEAGGTREQLQAIVEKTAEFQVSAAPPEPDFWPGRVPVTDNPRSSSEATEKRHRQCRATDPQPVTSSATARLSANGSCGMTGAGPCTQGAARRLGEADHVAYLGEATDAEDKDHMSFAYSSLDARRVANMLTMAECELVVTPDQLDTHPVPAELQYGSPNFAPATWSRTILYQFMTKPFTTTTLGACLSSGPRPSPG